MSRVSGSGTLLPVFVCLAAPAAAGPLPDELTISIGGHRQQLTRRRDYAPSLRRQGVMSTPLLQLGGQPELPVVPKLLVVVISSFLITLGLVELLIRPFKAMRMLFGMKPRRRKEMKA